VAKVDCIVPARNEERNLQATFQALASQTLPTSHVILVDDGSTDATCALATKFGFEIVHAKREKENLGWRERGSPQFAELFNTGLSRISGSAEYVMILGADHVLPADYLERLIDNMRRDGVSLASGVIAGEGAVIPRGSGRVGRVDHWKRALGSLSFPLCYGFETYLVIKMQMNGYRVGVYPELVSYTQRRTGSATNYVSYGRAMKFLGYTNEYALARAIVAAARFRDPAKAVQSVTGYVSYHYRSDVASYWTQVQRGLLAEYVRSPMMLVRRIKRSFNPPP
jgi:glycosyltransferase involved in cell wall biosynthesis